MGLLKPPPNLTVSQWADEERRLSVESSASPGRYRTKRTPYAREIMDAFNDPDVDEVVFVTSAQVGKTTVLENVLGYFIHHDPSPMLLFQPTLEMAETFSKDRLAPMVRDTPAINARMSEAGSRKGGNTILHKNFVGGQLTMAGANSEASKHSRPIRILLKDEVDLYEPGTTAAINKRITAFWNAKNGSIGTPKKKATSELLRLYAASDQRRYLVPCPNCGHEHELAFKALKYIEGPMVERDDGIRVRHATSAWFECPACDHKINDVERHRAIGLGYWKARAEFRGIAGFWLWQGYSMFRTALQTANEWLAAQGSVENLERVTNEVLAEGWVDRGEAPDWERVKARSAKYLRGHVPEGVLFLTAGIDVQGDRFEISIWGWGRGRSSWLIDHLIIDAKTSDLQEYSKLDAVVNATYGSLRLSAILMDAGTLTTNVYAYARRHKGAVLPIFGKDYGNALLWQGEAVDQKRDGKRKRRGLRPFLVNTFTAKRDTYGFLGLEKPEGVEMPPGWVSFPADMPDEYFRQLTAEQLVTRTAHGKRKQVWEPTRERNEALDCRVYAYAATDRVGRGMSRFTEQDWRALEQYLAPKKTPLLESAPVDDFDFKDEQAPVVAQPAAPVVDRQFRRRRRQIVGPASY